MSRDDLRVPGLGWLWLVATPCGEVSGPGSTDSDGAPLPVIDGGTAAADAPRVIDGVPARDALPGTGMPNSWESSHGLNPAMNDSATVRPSGYTAIEEYLDEVADALSEGSLLRRDH